MGLLPGQNEPSSEYEGILRKLYRGITELGFYTNAELKTIMKQAKESSPSTVINRLSSLQSGVAEHKQ